MIHPNKSGKNRSEDMANSYIESINPTGNCQGFSARAPRRPGEIHAGTAGMMDCSVGDLPVISESQWLQAK